MTSLWVVALLIYITEPVLSHPIRHLSNANACYTLGEEIGYGRYGIVHRCWPRNAGHEVAVKIILDYDPEAVERQLEFMKTFNRDDQYVGIPRLFDFYEDEGKHHIAMQLFEGTTLVKAKASLTPDRIMMILFKVVAIIERMHARRYAHGDLNATNILCNDDDDVMVIDCGGIKMKKEPVTMSLLLNADFGGPEIDNDECGYADDIYWLGMVCQELMEKCGEPYDQRLHEFFKKTRGAEPKDRLSAAELLRGPLFETERAALRLTDRDELASEETFLKIIKLKNQQNIVNFESFPDPYTPQPRLPATVASTEMELATCRPANRNRLLRRFGGCLFPSPDE